jgi:hypothetical protein
MAKGPRIGFGPGAEISSLRRELRCMSDAELVEFGRNARKRCIQATTVRDGVAEVQLEAARAEWQKRHSKRGGR